MMLGHEHLLPAELEFPTWKIAAWDEIETTADLLAARAAQLDREERVDRRCRAEASQDPGVELGVFRRIQTNSDREAED